MKKPANKNNKKPGSNLSKYRNQIIEFSGIEVKQAKKSKKSKLEIIKSKLSRKEKRKLERKLKHAKNLAFRSKTEMPNIDTILINTKKGLKKAKKNDETIETKALKKKKSKASKGIAEKKRIEEQSKLDIQRDDAEISKLEKLLHIKKDRKTYKKSFIDDGMDYLLDFCDHNKRKEIIKNEAGSNAWFGDDDDENTDDNDDDDEQLDDEKPKKRFKNVEIEEDDDYDDEDDDLVSEQSEEENNKSKKSSKKVKFADEIDSNEEDDDEEADFNHVDDDDVNEEQAKGYKEDIYGRLIDEHGNIVKENKSERLEKRIKELEERHLITDKVQIEKLQKQLNGLLNRLSTLNIHTISSQIIQIFYSNQYTRHDLINCIEKLIEQILLNKISLIPERLHAEYAALISILSSNIGIELGATVLNRFINLFNDTFKDLNCENFTIECKYVDNLLSFICYLYNFKLFSSKLIFDLMNTYLISNINASKMQIFEKLIDLLLIVLRKLGFLLRKDNPLMLKDFIIELKSKLNESNVDGENNRLKFMLESLIAIKNNDIRKLNEAFYAQDELTSEDIYENLHKRIKNLYSANVKFNDTQLNVNLKDMLNSNKCGKWWIVGSAWSNIDEDNGVSGEKIENEKITNKNQLNFNQQLLELARKQHMNTDVRRTIFCIIVSAEDYADAFVKLMKLSLKKQQEREIVYIIVHCALNEKSYNPYYTYLMQKFCDYDRRFKMTLQFHSWDKFKMFSSMTHQQIKNFSIFYSHLIQKKSMSLSVLKNVSFGEIDKSMLTFLRTLFINIFESCTDEQLQEVFMRISTYPQLSQLRQAIKLFITHFLVRNNGKSEDKQQILSDELLYKCELANKCLTMANNDL